MRHKGRTMFAALVAVLMLGAVASASASASLPEFVSSEGGFPITTESSASYNTTVKITDPYEKLYCGGVNTRGDITGAKAMSLTVELVNCNKGGTACYTVGSLDGTEILSGSASLAYISKSEKLVGIVFKVTPTELYCGAYWTGLRGSIVIPITPVGAKTSKLGLAIKGNGEGIAEYIKYENEKGEKINAHLEANYGAGYKQAALEIGETLSEVASKALTIKG